MPPKSRHQRSTIKKPKPQDIEDDERLNRIALLTPFELPAFISCKQCEIPRHFGDEDSVSFIKPKLKFKEIFYHQKKSFIDMQDFFSNSKCGNSIVIMLNVSPQS